MSASAQDASTGIQRAQAAATELQRGRIDEAITLFSEAVADRTLPNDRRALIHGDRALAYARRQNYKSAIEDFNRAVQLYPEHAAFYSNRGNILLTIGLTADAIADFDRAVLLAPSYAAAYNNRASARLRQNDIDLAIGDYTRAIELQPSLAAAFAGRGRAHLAARRPQAAARDLTRAVALDQSLAGAYRSRAEARAIIEQSDGVIEDLSRAIAFDARNAAIFIQRGKAYLTANNPASAIKDFSTALELDPASAEAYISRGIAEARAELLDDALNDLAKAIEIDPRSARGYAYRAWVYKLTQQAELGLKDIERAVRIDPASADVVWARGEVTEALGQPDAAIADYARAVEIDPKFREAFVSLARLGRAPVIEEEEVASGALAPWRVRQSGGLYTAVNTAQPNLRIPLEMLGRGQPKILEWDVKPLPYKGIGVLRYHAGQVDTPGGPEDLEHAAIIDVTTGAVVGVELQRKGKQVAAWKWDEGRLVVTSADGVTDEFQLGQQRLAEAKPIDPVPVAKKPARTWSDGQRTAERRQNKQKSLIQLLFGF